LAASSIANAASIAVNTWDYSLLVQTT
jgi:hypothetical protein